MRTEEKELKQVEYRKCGDTYFVDDFFSFRTMDSDIEHRREEGWEPVASGPDTSKVCPLSAFLHGAIERKTIAFKKTH